MFLAAVISFKDTSCKSYFPAQRREWTFKASLPPPERRKTLVGNLRDFFFFFLPVCRRRSKSLWESFGFSGFWQKKKKKRKKILFSFLFSCSFFSLKSWLQPADVQCGEFKSSVTVRRHQKQDSSPLKQQIGFSPLSVCRRRRVPSSLVELRLKFHRRRLSTAGRPDWCK